MEPTNDRFDDWMRLIKERRTNLRIDPGRPVGRELVNRLCEAAVWAPNHRLTEPWRFAALIGTARATLGEIAAGVLTAQDVDDAGRLEKARTKYLRAPAILVVGCARHEDPGRRAEDRDAVAAGVQNILLAATAAGLASYWATGGVVDRPETRRLCGFETDTAIVAVIYLGWPTAPAPPPARTAPQITWAGDATAGMDITSL